MRCKICGAILLSDHNASKEVNIENASLAEIMQIVDDLKGIYHQCESSSLAYDANFKLDDFGNVYGILEFLGVLDCSKNCDKCEIRFQCKTERQ